MLKHKLLTKFTLAVVALLLGSFFALPSIASAVRITCPDGFTVKNAPSGEREAICADHKTGGTAKDSEEACADITAADAHERCVLDNRPQSSSGSGGSTPAPPAGGTIEKAADEAFGGCANGGDEATGCGIVEKYVNPLINFLAAAVGMVVTIMIIVGGIQYSSAGGDPAKVTAAKNKIMNALIAFAVFLSLYAILSWLIPGGFF